MIGDKGDPESVYWVRVVDVDTDFDLSRGRLGRGWARCVRPWTIEDGTG